MALLICVVVAPAASRPDPSPPLGTVTVNCVRVVGSTSARPTKPFHVPPNGRRSDGTGSAATDTIGGNAGLRMRGLDLQPRGQLRIYAAGSVAIQDLHAFARSMAA